MSRLNGSDFAGGNAAVDDVPLDPPAEEQFWRKYNAHFECPIGFASAVLALVLMLAILVFGFLGLMNLGKDTKPVLISNLGGDDETGMGSPGGGMEENPIQSGQPTPSDLLRPELPQNLQEVKDDLNERIKQEDPSSNIPIPDTTALAFGALDKELQDKLLGATKGKGGTATGEDHGSGIGGTGADSTRARGLRWVLRFSTKSGRDYLAQLKALKATVMIPVPPDNKRMMIIRDPGNPRTNEFATDPDIAEQANKIQFQDVRKESNEAIAEALRIPVPSAFWAFFPKDLEAEMSRLETAYQNKRAEDIKETVYQVVVSGGEARLRVVAQRLK